MFLEVGPQQALTRLNRRIVDERTAPGIISCDNPKRPGVEQLYRVKALLECVGALEASDVSGQHSLAAAPAAHADAKPAKGSITYVDATLRRRKKMRDTATKSSHGESSPGIAQTVQPRVSTARTATGMVTAMTSACQSPAQARLPPWGRTLRPRRQWKSRQQQDQRIRSICHQPRLRQDCRARTTIGTGSVASSGDQGRRPCVRAIGNVPHQFRRRANRLSAEVVELDADLEADLGIDSIKKAQLFGELQEYFDVRPGGSRPKGLSLDEFTTLRHVLELSRQGTPTDRAQAGSAAVAADANLGRRRAGGARRAGRNAAPAAKPRLHRPPRRSPSRAVEAARPEPGNWKRSSSTSWSSRPAIRRSRRAGRRPGSRLGHRQHQEGPAVRRAARVLRRASHRRDLTLDDFPTLRHVSNFLQGIADEGPGQPRPQLPQRQRRPPQRRPAPVGRHGQPLARHTPAAIGPALRRQLPTRPAARRAEQLETFLINFVVEQTGYPPEVVELDADLEADLGIDSIKKAQLFGELAEYFDVTPSKS